MIVAVKDSGDDGAPAKGNALLNYCGIRQDFLDAFTRVDTLSRPGGGLCPASGLMLSCEIAG